jgi:hypothetical protein
VTGEHPGITGCNGRKSEDIMERTLLARVSAGVLLGVALLLAAGCTTYGAACKGGYPDGAGISNMSPYSGNPGYYQPPCTSRY